MPTLQQALIISLPCAPGARPTPAASHNNISSEFPCWIDSITRSIQILRNVGRYRRHGLQMKELRYKGALHIVYEVIDRARVAYTAEAQ